jgi:hypothetical protein
MVMFAQSLPMEAIMSSKVFRSSSAKQRFWKNHITVWRSSGLSQRLYCKQHGLAVQTFGYWHRKIKKLEEEKPRFFPLAVSAVTPPAPREPFGSDLEVSLCDSRFCVKVGRDFDPKTLRRLIASLEAMPCSAQAGM